MIKFPSNKFGSTIFFRLLLTYIIVIAPIVLLALYLYQWSYDNAREDVSRTTVSQLEYYLEDFDREIEWMEIQQYSFLEDNELKKLSITWESMSNVERHNSIVYVLDRLTTFKTSSPYIQDISIHIPNINKSISALNGIVALEQHYNELINSYLQSKLDRLFVWDNNMHLIGLKYGVAGYDPIYVIQITLNSNQIASSLDQLSIYPQSGIFIVTPSQFRIVNNQSAEAIVQSYMMRTDTDKNSNQSLFHSKVKYHLDQAYNSDLKLKIVSLIPEDTVKRPLRFFSQWVWMFIGAFFVAIIVVYYFTYRLIHKPMLLLIRSFRSMEEGNLEHSIQHENKDEFGFIYERFNQMLFKLKGLIDQDYKQKMMMQRSELKQLQSQINPHFLYNSFFILNSLAKIQDVEKIEKFTVMLGEYFRFITRNNNDLVSLAEEVKHSRMYTEIQELRFSRRIKVIFDDLPKQYENLKVPRLIIQPIIENAYEHSLEQMDENGLLCVRFDYDDQYLTIVIEDSGKLLTDEALQQLQKRLWHHDMMQETTGMINIHRRLKLTFGKQSGIYLSRSEYEGLKVSLSINLSNIEH